MKELLKLVLATGVGVFLTAVTLAALFPDNFRGQPGRGEAMGAPAQRQGPHCAPHPVKFPCLQKSDQGANHAA